jgi:hypothetical protein
VQAPHPALAPAPAQPSLLQSLLQPLRAREAVAGAAAPHPWSEPPSAALSPREEEEQVLLAGSTGSTGTAVGGDAASAGMVPAVGGEVLVAGGGSVEPGGGVAVAAPAAAQEWPAEVASLVAAGSEWAPWRSMVGSVDLQSANQVRALLPS